MRVAEPLTSLLSVRIGFCNIITVALSAAESLFRLLNHFCTLISLLCLLMRFGNTSTAAKCAESLPIRLRNPLSVQVGFGNRLLER